MAYTVMEYTVMEYTVKESTWEPDSKDHEMALETRVDDETAARGVHRTHKLAVLNNAQLQLRKVIPVLVLKVLSQQADSGRRIIHI